MRSFVSMTIFLALGGCMNHARSENGSGAESARASEAVQVFPTSYICGRLEIDPGVRSDVISAGDEKGLLNVVFRRFGQRLRQLGLSLESTGDTSGSRFRSGPGRQDHCKAAADIELIVSVAPGPTGGPDPARGHPAIEPYKLTLSLRQGDVRASSQVSRRRGEVNSKVFLDPRVATPSSAAAASIADDIAELATSLAPSLERGA